MNCLIKKKIIQYCLRVEQSGSKKWKKKEQYMGHLALPIFLSRIGGVWMLVDCELSLKSTCKHHLCIQL
jgi:hypothetical protein